MTSKHRILSFCNTLCLYLDSNCCITGPLVKHLFPNFSPFSCSLWQPANCIFTINKTITEFVVRERFTTCISTLIQNKTMGEFIIQHFCIQGLSKPIPTCKIVFAHIDGMQFDITFYAWVKQCKAIFDLDTLCYTSTGLHCAEGQQTFFKLMQNIINKEARYIGDIQLLQDKAFPDKAVPLEYKQKMLTLLYECCTTPLLQLQEDGFVVKGKKPVVLFETNDECSITGCKPVFPCFQLMCNHYVSFPAYKGLITAMQEDTESLRCPFCRSDLKIKFVVDETSPIESNWKTNVHPAPKWRSKWIQEDGVC